VENERAVICENDEERTRGLSLLSQNRGRKRIKRKADCWKNSGTKGTKDTWKIGPCVKLENQKKIRNGNTKKT